MPNWCENMVIITLPEANKDRLMEALKGPSWWRLPREVSDEPIDLNQSGHEAIDILAHSAEIEAKFRAAPENADFPDWMPVGYQDLMAAHRNDYEDIPVVPFSVPKIDPIVDREQFDRYFPGTTEGGHWKAHPLPTMRVADPEAGMDLLFEEKMGNRRILFEVEFDIETSTKDGHIEVIYQFNTAWAPLRPITRDLKPLLDELQASALQLWHESGNAFAGYDHYAVGGNKHGPTDINYGKLHKQVVEDHRKSVASPEQFDEHDIYVSVGDVRYYAEEELGLEA